MADRKNTRKLALIALFWVGSIGAGLGYLQKYASAPAPMGAPPSQWPSGTHLTLDPVRPTLLVFAHPRCPCTRASIGELSLLMTRCQGKVSARVLFFEPEAAADDWAKTDLWDSAAAIPNVTAQLDKGGREARLFKVEASGHALLFSSDGALRFSGGITASRGHSGDNAGRSTLVAEITGARRDFGRTPVYGCALFDPN
jgi:hypothetical protein